MARNDPTIDARWARFHSLPGPRRIPRDGPHGEDDVAELLHRQTTLIGELCDRAPPGFLYRPRWPDADSASSENQQWDDLPLRWQDWAIVRDEEDPDAPQFRLVIAAATWHADWNETWLRATAELNLSMGVPVAEDASWLAATYDGGIDLVPPDCVAREDLVARHPSWRPRRGDL